jgi:hypothetical protein
LIAQIRDRVEQGQRVIAIDDLSTGRLDNISPGRMIADDTLAVYLGFSPGFGTAYIDNIMVEDDVAQIPAEISQFSVD